MEGGEAEGTGEPKKSRPPLSRTILPAPNAHAGRAADEAADGPLREIGESLRQPRLYCVQLQVRVGEQAA